MLRASQAWLWLYSLLESSLGLGCLAGPLHPSPALYQDRLAPKSCWVGLLCPPQKWASVQGNPAMGY